MRHFTRPLHGCSHCLSVRSVGYALRVILSHSRLHPFSNPLSERVDKVPLRPEAERERRGRRGRARCNLLPVSPRPATTAATLAASRSPARFCPHALSRGG